MPNINLLANLQEVFKALKSLQEQILALDVIWQLY